MTAVTIRIAQHRRFTANHTWQVDWAEQTLFVKANPQHDEAMAECAGHARLRDFYPIPRLRGWRRIARWTVIVYDRWPHLGTDTGLLLDEITSADFTADLRSLDKCLTAVFGHYADTIARTLRQTTNAETIVKLYRGRAAPGGRLDTYYLPDEPWVVATTTTDVRPSELAGLRLVVNGRHLAVDFAEVVAWLRTSFADSSPVWTAVTQGDPTDINIGWSPEGGPVWFDYDTAGLNALAGEFACFLVYQRLHGDRLTPHYNPAAFRDHPSAVVLADLAWPDIQVDRTRSSLRIDHRHAPSLARQHVLRRYLDDVVHPIVGHLGIDDLMSWLRPYLVMRLLAVYNLGSLEPRDTALSLALLAQALHPTTSLPEFLALTQTPRPPEPSTEVFHPWPVPSPSSPEPAPASARPSPRASPIATT